MRWAGAVTLFLVLTLTGCGAREPAATAKPSYSFQPDEVVLQIYSPGWRSNPQPVELVPEVTLWGNGRVLFGAADGSLQESRLTDSDVQRLVQAATVLYSLSGRYEDLQGTDLPQRVYSVQTSRGQRSVTVIGLHQNEGPADEPDHADLERLRQLRRTVREALPKTGQPPRADRVQVQFWGADPTEPVRGEWPPELHGTLAGDAAKQATDLAPIGERTVFRVDGKVQSVLVLPDIPLLQN